MKKVFLPCLLIALLFPGLGCLTMGDFPSKSSNASTSCPMTKIPFSPSSNLSNAGIRVIHNQAEWDNYYKDVPWSNPTSAPIPPPIDFTTQMLIIAAVPSPCYNTTLTIKKVCEDDNQVTVYIISRECPTCATCFIVANSARPTSEVAVPLSNLPVSFDTKHVTVTTTADNE
jgi:hypothetical protein